MPSSTGGIPAVSRSVDSKILGYGALFSFSVGGGACSECSQSDESRCVSMVCKRRMAYIRKSGNLALLAMLICLIGSG